MFKCECDILCMCCRCWHQISGYWSIWPRDGSKSQLWTWHWPILHHLTTFSRVWSRACLHLMIFGTPPFSDGNTWLPCSYMILYVDQLSAVWCRGPHIRSIIKPWSAIDLGDNSLQVHGFHMLSYFTLSLQIELFLSMTLTVLLRTENYELYVQY